MADSWCTRQNEKNPYKIILREHSAQSRPNNGFDTAEKLLQTCSLVLSEPFENDKDIPFKLNDNLVTGLLQIFLGVYEFSSVKEIIGFIENNEDCVPLKSSNINERRILQIELLQLIQAAQTETFQHAVESCMTVIEVECSDRKKLLGFIQDQLGRKLQLIILDASKFPLKFTNEQLTPDSDELPIIFLHQDDSLKLILHRASIFTNEEDYWDDLLAQLTESQALLHSLQATLTQPKFEVESYVETKLETELPEIKTISDFATKIVPTQPQLQFLDQMVLEEGWIKKSDSYSHADLLTQLKRLYIESLSEACNTFYMEQASTQSENIAEIQAKKQQIEQEIEDGKLEIARAEAEVASARQAAADVTQQMTQNDDGNAELDKKLASLKNRMAFLKFKSVLWKKRAKYEAVVEGLPKNLEDMDYISTVKFILDNYNCDDEDSDGLLDAVNNTKENEEALHDILKNLHAPPVVVTRRIGKGKKILEITGRNMTLSQIQDKFITHKISGIRIMSTNQLFIDRSLQKEQYHGRNVSILCERIEVKVPGLEINVSGLAGSPLEVPPNADNGKQQGRDGYEGKDGEAGEPSGNVFIRCNKFLNSNYLKIVCNGGNGGHGQTGGNGQNGSDGSNGEDGQLPNGWLWGTLSAVKTYFRQYRIEPGTPGKHGEKGGNGGRAGLGGGHGLQGSITVQCSTPEKTTKEFKDGIQGQDGLSGRSGILGTGGRHGVDDGVVHQGSWCPLFDGRTWGKGKLSTKVYNRWYGFAGYELIFLQTEAEVRKSRATNGNKGQNGEKAEDREDSRNMPATKTPINTEEVLTKYMELMSLNSDNSVDLEVQNAQREGLEIEASSRDKTKEKGHLQEKLEEYQLSQRESKDRQEGFEAAVKAQNKDLENEVASLNLAKATLHNTLNEKKKVMEIVNDSKSAMTLQSLQQIQQQAQQATVLRQYDGSNSSKKAPPPKAITNSGPSYSKPGVESKSEPSFKDFGLSIETIIMIEKNEILIQNLKKLSTIGDNFMKAMFTRSPNLRLLPILQKFEDSSNKFKDSINLLKAENLLLEEIKPSASGVFPTLMKILEDIFHKNVKMWMAHKIHEFDENVETESTISLASRVHGMVKNIPNLGSKTGFAQVGVTLLEILLDKKSQIKGTDHVINGILLRLAKITTKVGTGPVTVIKEMLKTRIQNTGMISTLRYILPYLFLIPGEMDEINLAIVTAQCGLLLYNKKEEQLYQELKLMQEIITRSFNTSYTQPILQQVVSKCNAASDKKEAEKLKNFFDRLENPYSHVHFSFQKKQELYRQLLESDNLDNLEKESFPLGTYLVQDIHKKLTQLRLVSSDIIVYKELMRHCDVVQTKNGEASFKEVVQLFRALENLKFPTPLGTSLLVLDGVYQIHTLTINTIISKFTKKLNKTQDLANTDLYRISKLLEEIGKILLDLFNPLESVLRKEEIIHSYLVQLTKLAVGWLFLSTSTGSLDKVSNSSKTLEMLQDAKDSVEDYASKCLDPRALLEKLDQLVSDLDVDFVLEFKKYDDTVKNMESNLKQIIETGKITKEQAESVTTYFLFRWNFTSTQLNELDTIKEAEVENHTKMLSDFIKLAGKKENNPEIKSLAVNLIPILNKDTVGILASLEKSLKTILNTKHDKLCSIVGEYSMQCQSFYNLWKRLQADTPVFGGPLIHYITKTDEYFSEIEKFHEINPSISAAKVMRSSLAKYFEDDPQKFGIPKEVAQNGKAFSKDFSKLLSTLAHVEKFMEEKWMTNFFHVLNEILHTFSPSCIGSVQVLEPICQQLEAMKATENCKNGDKDILRQMQEKVAQISKQVWVSASYNGEEGTLERSELALVSIWISHSPAHLPQFCKMYNNWNTLDLPSIWSTAAKSKADLASIVYNTNLSPEESSLFQKAMTVDDLTCPTPPNPQDFVKNEKPGNRFIQLFDTTFLNQEWMGEFALFNREENSIIARMKFIGVPDWSRVKEIMMKVNCTQWVSKFEEVLLCHQFSDILALFSTQSKAKDPQLSSVLSKFESHYDISPTDNENLINLTTSKVPKESINVMNFIKFKSQFNRCLALCGNRWNLSTWLLAVQAQIINSDKISLLSVTHLLAKCAEQDHKQLHQITMSHSKDNWIGEILLHILSTEYGNWSKQLKNTNISILLSSSFSQEMRKSLKIDTLKNANNFQIFFSTMIHCLAQESRTSTEFSKPEADHCQSILKQLSKTDVKYLLAEKLYERLLETPLARWTTVLREEEYLRKYEPSLVNTILRFESKIGLNNSEQFVSTFGDLITPPNLEILLHKFCNQVWIFDNKLVEDLNKIANKHKDKKSPEELLNKFSQACAAYTEKQQSAKRDVAELVRLMKLENKNQGIAERYLNLGPDAKQGEVPKLQEFVDSVRNAYKSPSKLAAEKTKFKPVKEWGKKEIYLWSGSLLYSKKRMSLVTRFSRGIKKIKRNFGQTALDLLEHIQAKKITKPEMVEQIRSHLYEVIAVCMRGLELGKKEVSLRDTQLIAILLLLDHSRKSKSCLAEVATGEGKTLILAVVVAIKTLEGDNVDLVTSSSVLASEALAEVKPFFSLFSITCAVNCDVKTEDENVRKGRYQNSVIYGDIGSFQRDILLTEFFGKRITMGRNADVVVVDEVDSMLLDKGDNILYLSHNIPELKLLSPLLLEIWQAVHAPDVQFGLPQDIIQVVMYIKCRIRDDAITFPNYLQKFVKARLPIWVKNAFIAKNIEEKDAYIVTNLEQKGHRVVLMDKDTGVEQTSMHYNGGLHQFMQLKHGEKLSPESLKAVFMSNITYLKRFSGQLIGITGTLGSEMERSLLAQCYGVEFFQIPRFSCRRCIEEDAIVVETQEQWLAQIEAAVKQAILTEGSSVLIIAENVKKVELISTRLKTLEWINESNIFSYMSAFDTEFNKKRDAAALDVGEVVVATNIAGRGTDLQTSDKLNDSGGLRVILSFLASNIRIEEQAFGRTARAGNKGRVQYIVDVGTTPFSNGQKSIGWLRNARDDAESKRLNQFKQSSIPRIEMEEKLFQKFTTLLQHIKGKLETSTTTVPKKLLEIHLDNLKNRWALWLDSVGERIQTAVATKSDAVFKEFDAFSREINSLFSSGVVREGRVLFERGPFEVTRLGRLYEANEQFELAMSYFNRVINDEPHYSEVARYYLSACILRKYPINLDQRKLSKRHLKICRKSLQDRIYSLSASIHILAMINEKKQKEGVSHVSGGYEIMVRNECELMQIHIGKINEAVGSPIDVSTVKQIKGVLDDKEALELFQVLAKLPAVIQDFRISRKIEIDLDKKEIKMPKYGSSQYKNINWLSTYSYCHSEMLELLSTAKTRYDRKLEENEIEPFIFTKEKVWNYLKENNLIENEVTTPTLQVKFEEKVFQDIAFPEKYSTYKSTVKNILVENHEKDFEPDIFGKLKLTEHCIKWLKEKLTEKEILVEMKKLSATLQTSQLSINTKTGKVEGLLLDKKMKKYSGIINHIFIKKSQTEEANIRDGIVELGSGLPQKSSKFSFRSQVVQNNIPLPNSEQEGAKILWRFFLQNGILKQPKVNFDSSIAASEAKVKKRFEQMETTLGKSTELKQVLEKYHEDPQTRPAISDVHGIIQNCTGSLNTTEHVLIGYDELADYYTNCAAGVFPIEIQSFRDQLFHHVLKIGKHSWWTYWGPTIVALIGVVCIIVGVLITCCSGGIAAFVGSVLISEGIGDIAYAIQAHCSGHFSWGEYGLFKLLSVTLTVLGAGIFAWLSKGAHVGKFAGVTGYALFAAVGGQVIRKLGQAVAFTAADMMLTTILDKIREFIVDKCKGIIAEKVPEVVNKQFAKLEKEMDSVYSNSYEKSQPKRLIGQTFTSVLQEAKMGFFGSNVYSKSSEIASGISGGISRAAGKLWASGNTHHMNYDMPTGINYQNRSGNLNKIFKYINSAIIIGRILKAILEMITYADRVLDKFAEKLGSISRNLGKQKRSREENKETIQRLDSSSYNEYKIKLKEQISVDIVNYMASQVQHGMIQPLIQQRMYQILRKVGNSAMRKTNSIFSSLYNKENGIAMKEHTTQEKFATTEEGVLNADNVDPDTPVTVLGKDGKPIGITTVGETLAKFGDNVQLYINSEGKVVINRVTFENFVKSIGQGKCASVLEFQACAKVVDATTVIIDETGDLNSSSPDGKLVIHGASGKPDASRPVFVIKITKDEFGNRHCQAVIDGVTIDVPQSEGQQNTCLFQAFQVHLDVKNGTYGGPQNVDASKLISQVQKCALQSDTLRNVYNHAYEVHLDLDFGAKKASPTPKMLLDDYKNRHIMSIDDYIRISSFPTKEERAAALEAYMLIIVGNDSILRASKPRKNDDILNRRENHTFIISDEGKHLSAVENANLAFVHKNVDGTTHEIFGTLHVTRDISSGPGGRRPINSMDYFSPRQIIVGVQFDASNNTYYPVHFQKTDVTYPGLVLRNEFSQDKKLYP